MQEERPVPWNIPHNGSPARKTRLRSRLMPQEWAETPPFMPAMGQAAFAAQMDH